MLRIAICDDESMFLNKIKSIISDICVELNIKFVVDVYNDGYSLIENYNRYHLIFLDIYMPNMDGISVCEEINSKKGLNDIPYIVFLTSKDNMVFTALKAYPYSFIRKTDLFGDIKKCISAINKKVKSANQEYAVKSGRNVVLLSLTDILYLEKDKNYIIYHTSSLIYKERSNMDEKENELIDKGFIRLHIGYLVNAKHITNLEAKKVILDNGTEISISKKYKESARKKYFDWLVDEIK